MSFIDDFRYFFENSDPARRAEIETVLQSIMQGDVLASGLTAEQLAEDDRRYRDPENVGVDIQILEKKLGAKILP